MAETYFRSQFYERLWPFLPWEDRFLRLSKDASGETSMASASLLRPLSNDGWNTLHIQQPQPHILFQDQASIPSYKSTLVLKPSRSTDSQGIHSSSRLVRPTETCCRQRRHGRNHLTQQREQDLSSSTQVGSYMACRLPSSDTRSGDPSPLCKHWMLSLSEKGLSGHASAYTAPRPIAWSSHGQCPAGPCCHFQV